MFKKKTYVQKTYVQKKNICSKGPIAFYATNALTTVFLNKVYLWMQMKNNENNAKMFLNTGTYWF